MYARDVGDQTLTFVVSGLLWNRSLVMMDEETNSLWSHILGESKWGQLKGVKLETLPGVITDWSTWCSAHPDTTVLMMSRTTGEFRRDFYRNLSDFVLGMSHSVESKAWPYDQLQHQPVVNDEFAGVPIVVFFDESSASVFAYDRRLGDKVLSFHWHDGGIREKETGVLWNAATGQSVSPRSQQQRLEAVVAVVSYRHIWATFYPATQYWSAD